MYMYVYVCICILEWTRELNSREVSWLRAKRLRALRIRKDLLTACGPCPPWSPVVYSCLLVSPLVFSCPMVARASGLVVRTPDTSVAGDPGFDSRLVHFRSTVFEGPGAALGASWGAPGGSWSALGELLAALGSLWWLLERPWAFLRHRRLYSFACFLGGALSP